MSDKSSTLKIQCTKNYDLFVYDEVDNREITPDEHRRLSDSLDKYGFIQSLHIICRRTPGGKLKIKEGQHRFYFAKLKGLPIYYTIEEVDFDVADIQVSIKNWKPIDYARRFAKQGLTDYAEAIEFCEAHRIDIGTGFALLSGKMDPKSIREEFHSGKFRIRNRAQADRVAFVYCSVIAKNRKLKNVRFLQACMACCKVPDFDGKKFVKSVESNIDKLNSFSTREAFLEMIEEIYNFRRSEENKIPLKFAAERELDKLNPVKNRKRNDANVSMGGQ